MALWDPGPAAQPGDTLPMQLERVVLNRIKVAAQAAVTRRVLEDADLQMVGDHLTDTLLVKLTSFVLAEHLASHTETATVRWPATSYDAWVYEHPRAYSWISRYIWRLPPARQASRTLVTTWTEQAAYPYAQLRVPPDPKMGPVVLWRTSTSHLEDD
jgi:hypothetical protein